MLPSLEQDTLPDALKGLALLGACPERPWVDDVMLRSHTVMRHMKGGQLATAVWAFSRFKRAPYKQWTFDFFACCRNESAGMAACAPPAHCRLCFAVGDWLAWGTGRLGRWVLLALSCALPLPYTCPGRNTYVMRCISVWCTLHCLSARGLISQNTAVGAGLKCRP